MALRYAVRASLCPCCSAATRCSVAFSVISLICSDFISVLLCGDLVPSHGAGEPKNRVRRRTEVENPAPERKGNRRDTGLRGGATVCSAEAQVESRKNEGASNDAYNRRRLRWTD